MSHTKRRYRIRTGTECVLYDYTNPNDRGLYTLEPGSYTIEEIDNPEGGIEPFFVVVGPEFVGKTVGKPEWAWKDTCQMTAEV